MPGLRRMQLAAFHMITIILLFFVSIPSVSGQSSSDPISPNQLSPSVQFEHLTIDDGLSQSVVTAIFQDSKGDSAVADLEAVTENETNRILAGDVDTALIDSISRKLKAYYPATDAKLYSLFKRNLSPLLQ